MDDSLFDIAHQVTLITGGTRGIGRAIAEGFRARSATVVVCSREAASVAAAVEDLQGKGLAVEGLCCDITDSGQIRETVETVISRHGRIDTLVNVAGVNRRQRAEAFAPDDYDFILDTNLRGAFLMCQAVGRHMLERQAGTIINIESLSSRMPLKGMVPYAMSKMGMQAMTRGLALEWGCRNIRVNSIAPGFILTDLTRGLWSDPTMQQWNTANVPLGRLGTPDDLVGAAVFLASAASRFMTGQTLYVDGGMSSGWSWPISLDQNDLQPD